MYKFINIRRKLINDPANCIIPNTSRWKFDVFSLKMCVFQGNTIQFAVTAKQTASISPSWQLDADQSVT